ncbi:hypothetical protein RhiirC2_818176 [Rhizophagus irregularis]|uniref:Uncharacterized protein n=1 Tax=Rhizophagus irregularis TaxID=588596 RepID=A0A2N1NN33_9GLOM|nr:hypothetical protein RhiirC2_818176 [Rhizophagus irregularis]
MKSAYLMYVTQGIDENNKKEKWNKLTAEAGRSNKGKIPGWFTCLEKALIKDQFTHEVYSCYEISKDVYDDYRNERKVNYGIGRKFIRGLTSIRTKAKVEVYIDNESVFNTWQQLFVKEELIRLEF